MLKKTIYQKDWNSKLYKLDHKIEKLAEISLIYNIEIRSIVKSINQKFY